MGCNCSIVCRAYGFTVATLAEAVGVSEAAFEAIVAPDPLLGLCFYCELTELTMVVESELAVVLGRFRGEFLDTRLLLVPIALVSSAISCSNLSFLCFCAARDALVGCM